jgi:hypothetical protein
VADPAAPLRHAPSPDAPLDTEALKGERVTVYETSDEGWAWGQLDADGYVGFVPAAALRDPGSPPTHKVSVLRTLVFPGPSIKLPPIEGLSLGCRLAVARDQIRRRGGLLLITARFLPGGRTVLTLTCGATLQPRKWFMAWDLAAVLIWATYSAGMGSPVL